MRRMTRFGCYYNFHSVVQSNLLVWTCRLLPEVKREGKGGNWIQG